MSAFASINVKDINSKGPAAFEASGVISNLSTNCTSSDVAVVNEAMEAIKSITEGVDQWIEPFMVDFLPVILDGLANPKTSAAAKDAGDAILKKSNSHSVRIITNKLYESFTAMKWQTKKVSHNFTIM